MSSRCVTYNSHNLEDVEMQYRHNFHSILTPLLCIHHSVTHFWQYFGGSEMFVVADLIKYIGYKRIMLQRRIVVDTDIGGYRGTRSMSVSRHCINICLEGLIS